MIMTLQSEIRRILNENQIVKNASRKKFLGFYIPALVQSNSVQFYKTAKFLNSDVKIQSNMTRIQSDRRCGFYREVEIDYDFVAVLLLPLLPKSKQLRICIDRTEWNFGKTQINILMILVGQGDFQIQFYWEMLENKSGNSNSGDRIDLLDKVFKIIDKKRIGLIVADREFIGHNRTADAVVKMDERPSIKFLCSSSQKSSYTSAYWRNSQSGRPCKIISQRYVSN